MILSENRFTARIKCGPGFFGIMRRNLIARRGRTIAKRPRFPGAAMSRANSMEFLALELLDHGPAAVAALDDGLAHAGVAMAPAFVADVAMTPAFVTAAVAMDHDLLRVTVTVAVMTATIAGPDLHRHALRARAS